MKIVESGFIRNGRIQISGSTDDVDTARAIVRGPRTRDNRSADKRAWMVDALQDYARDGSGAEIDL